MTKNANKETPQTDDREEMVVDTNAGPDAIQGTIANADVKENGGQKAPERDPEQKVNKS